MTLGSRDWKPWALDEDESKPILKQALDCGFTFFDMADWYSTGENERVVASTLTSMVPRDQLVLTTKATYPTVGLSHSLGQKQPYKLGLV